MALQDKLIPVVEELYGKRAGELTHLEKSSLHLITAFSHIEFLAWALVQLKKAAFEEDHKKEQEFRTYIGEYVDQLRRMSPLLEFKCVEFVEEILYGDLVVPTPPFNLESSDAQ